MNLTAAIDKLNPDEAEVFKSMVNAMITPSGELNYSVLESLYLADYDEIPVTVDQFISDPQYLGGTYEKGERLFPFWRQFLHELFHENPNNAYEVALTGCLSGDTMIPLLNGKEISIRELYLSKGKQHYVYSYDTRTNRYTVGKTSDVIFTGFQKVYKVTLDNGESVEVTSDHKFLTRDKHWVSIDKGLEVGISLMPFERSSNDSGYEVINHPLKDGTSLLELTHKMVSVWKGTPLFRPWWKSVHHKNFNKRDNSPENLCYVTNNAHKRYHSKHMKDYLSLHYDTWHQNLVEGTRKARKEHPERYIISEENRKLSSLRLKDSLQNSPDHERNLREAQRAFVESERGKEVSRQNLSEYNRKLQDPNSEEYKNHLPTSKKGLEVRWQDPSQREAARARMTAQNMDPEFQRRAAAGKKPETIKDLSEITTRRNKDPEFQLRARKAKYLSILNKLLTSSGVAITEDNYREVGEELGIRYLPSMETIQTYYGGFSEALNQAKAYNHKVVSVVYVGVQDVYDLTVEGHHNFALASGVVVHNCIGSGKSTVAGVIMTYLIYRTLCLKDPRAFYKLTGNAPIVFVVMNLTLDLAYNGLYSLIVENIKQSPWFQKRVKIRGNYDYIIEFGKGISLIAGSNTQHVIGKNVLGAVMDEVNFSNAARGSKNSIMDLYLSITRRMESRFMKAGRQPGMIVLVSSKNTELDFLEQYINSVRASKRTIVVDKAIYDIKPPETYLGPRFKVAVGDKTKSSFIIKNDEMLAQAEEQGYQIIDVPEEHRKAFEFEINSALREIAGISTFSTSKLFPTPTRIFDCIDKTLHNPFGIGTIMMGLDTEDRLIDYLDDIRSLEKDSHLPRFAHCDIGLSGDAFGFAIVHVPRKKLVDRTDITGLVESRLEMVAEVDLLLRIKAVPGSEVPLYKLREFIAWLSRNYFKFGKITFDGFQSADSIQLLKTMKFPADLLSLDRNDIPYLNLRSCVMDKRLLMPRSELLVEELSNLEHDKKNKKVDHPILSYDGAPGSKDLADAVCGAVYNAFEHYAKDKKGASPQQPHNVARNLKVLKTFQAEQQKAQRGGFDDDWILT